jgi:hypothetical protein
MAQSLEDKTNALREQIHNDIYQAGRLNLLTLKQIRDSGPANNAVYQAIVRVPVQIRRPTPWKPIPGALRVNIHQNPSFPIQASLGLSQGNTYLSRPKRANVVFEGYPFFSTVPVWTRWFGSGLRIDRPTNLAWRDQATGGVWRMAPFRQEDGAPGEGPAPPPPPGTAP